MASVAKVKGCHTQGRTIDEARRRIREALSLFVKDADHAKLVDQVKLPTHVRQMMQQWQRSRRRAEQEQTRAMALTREAVKSLQKELHLSVRDVGNLLNLSHQRVQQLVQEG